MNVFAPMRAELFRLTRSRAGRVGLLTPALLGAGQILGSELVARIGAARRMAQGLEPAEPTTVTAFGSLADGVGGIGSMALALIALLIGAFALARERDAGSLGLLVLARSRGATVAGKALGSCLYVVTAFVLLFVASLAAAALIHDFTGVVEDGYEMAPAGELWLESLRASAAGLPALLACACFGLCVSALSASVGAAAVGAVLPFMLLALFQSALGRVADKLFLTYAPLLSEHSPLVRLKQVARAFNDAHWGPGELQRAALVPTIEGVAFVVVAWIATRKRDV